MNTVVSRNERIVGSTIDGEVVVMNIQDGQYYGMDDIGSRIWNLLETPRTIDALIGELLAEFDIERQTCEKDILPFLERLLVAGLICIRRERQISAG